MMANPVDIDIDINLYTGETMKAFALFDEQVKKAFGSTRLFGDSTKDAKFKVVVKPWRKRAVPILVFMEGR